MIMVCEKRSWLIKNKKNKAFKFKIELKDVVFILHNEKK